MLKPGDLLRWRERHSLTQTEAAALLDVTLRTWQRWERGEADVRGGALRLIQLTNALPGAYQYLVRLALGEAAQRRPSRLSIHVAELAPSR